eukprot:gene2647-3844_t
MSQSNNDPSLLGWLEIYDEENDRNYYFNPETQESSWYHPQEQLQQCQVINEDETNVQHQNIKEEMEIYDTETKQKVENQSDEQIQTEVEVLKKETIEENFTETEENQKTKEEEIDLENQKLKDDIKNELIKTEKKFLDDLNVFVVEYYMNFSQNPKIVSEKTTKSIFSTIKLIYSIHSTLLLDLDKLQTSNNDNETIGKIFLKFSPYLKSYSDYMNYMEETIQLIKDLQSNDKKFRQFYDKLEKKYKQKLNSYSVFLMMPISRLQKYEVFLRKTLDIEKNEEECKDLNSSRNSILNVQEEMNNKLKEHEGKKKLIEIQKRIDHHHHGSTNNAPLTPSTPLSPLSSPLPKKKSRMSFPLKTRTSSSNFKSSNQLQQNQQNQIIDTNIIQPYRNYILHADLKLIPDYGIESKKGEIRQIYLFSDSIMICEEDEKLNLKFEELTSLITVPLPWTRDISVSIFQLITKSKTYTFDAKEEDEKHHWMNEINKVIDDLIQNGNNDMKDHINQKSKPTYNPALLKDRSKRHSTIDENKIRLEFLLEDILDQIKDYSKINGI